MSTTDRKNLVEGRLRPELLYSYSPGGSWLPACLAGKSLKFSSRLEFNDPFDSRPAYKVNKGKEGGDFIHDRLKRTHLSPANRLKALRAIRRRTLVERPLGELDDFNLLDEFGMLCLTEEWDEPLFWGHYAAKHTGICIAFRTDRDVFQFAEDIVYQNELPVILRPQDDPKTMLNKTFLTKSDAWQYEKEWRIIKQKSPDSLPRQDQYLEHFMDQNSYRLLTENRGAGIYEFDPTAIESITMGLLITKPDEKFVIETVQKSGYKLPVYKAVKHPTQYKITRSLVKVQIQ